MVAITSNLSWKMNKLKNEETGGMVPQEHKVENDFRTRTNPKALIT